MTISSGFEGAVGELFVPPAFASITLLGRQDQWHRWRAPRSFSLGTFRYLLPLGMMWVKEAAMATQIVMDHSGDTRHWFDQHDTESLLEAEERFRKLSESDVGLSAMHDDLDILKDPLFWGVLLAGVLPIAMLGAVLVWWD
jgi:hypothetical protein